MPQPREVNTCDRCRSTKRACDLQRPSCSRCVQVGSYCSFASIEAEMIPQISGLALAPSATASADEAQRLNSIPQQATMSSSVGTSHGTVYNGAQRTLASPLSSPPRRSNEHGSPSMGSNGSKKPTKSASRSSATSKGSGTSRASSLDERASFTATSSISPDSGDPSGSYPAIADAATRSDAAAAFVAAGDSLDSAEWVDEPSAVDDGRAATLTSASAAKSANTTPPIAGTHRVVRKRKRNCLSCLRCHRLKVKCDKELPCGRCKASGNGPDCYYSYNKGPNGGKFPCAVPAPPPAESKTHPTMTWKSSHRVRGSSHWKHLVTRIYALAGSPPGLLKALSTVATNACLSNFSLPGNFPFGTPGASKYYARDAVTRLVESERANCKMYIDRYLELLDCVNPILQIDDFKAEVEQYWEDPHGASLDWMAQFLMVLGLGCFCSPDEPPAAVELMMAAEACLMQTPFMFRPTFTMLKTICLMVLAQQICNATCWAVDACWSLLGLLIRLAFICGLPQEKNEDDEVVLDPKERDARRKLWVTIVYLDIKVSTGAGMPPVTRPEELGSLKDMPDWGKPDDSLQMVLYQALPTVLKVLSHVNSEGDEIAYEDVLRYAVQLRELMAYAKRICTGQLQWLTIDIFLRRCLMVMHRSFALHPEGPTLFPESYYSSLECSLALLIHYRELWCHEPSARLDLLGRSFVPDFFVASLTAYVHVLRKDAPLAGAQAAGCEVWPRQIILDTMHSCVDIWSGEEGRSVCYRTGYNILVAILEILPKATES